MKTFEPGQDVDVLMPVPEEPGRQEWMRAKYEEADSMLHLVRLSDGNRFGIPDFMVRQSLPPAEVVEHFDCQCHALRHTIRFDFDPEDGILTLSPHLTTWLPWYRRVWLALKYALGADTPCAAFDEVVIRHQDYRRLRGLIERAERFEMKRARS